MSTKIIEEQANSAPIETKPLQEVMDVIRRDSQLEPQVYLDESKVPHGGE